MLTIALNKIAPDLLERYLARTGYAAQQTGQPEDPERPFNLWRPVSGDRGAHGRFDRQAHRRSIQLWILAHWPWPAAASGVILALGFILFL